MPERIHKLISLKHSFTIETTLASKSFKNIIQKAKQNGYSITLAYFWLDSPLLAIDRVKSRVERGGHSIPPDVIKRRYYSGIENLFSIYIPICNRWMIFDNSRFLVELVASGKSDKYIKIENYSTFIKQFYHAGYNEKSR